jgi:NitT/TauT family transport system substrate-binding protein
LRPPLTIWLGKNRRGGIMQRTPSRRRVLATLSSAAAAGLICGTEGSAQEAPPEITTIRLAKIPGVCIAPQYVAEELLRAEGFSNVQYIDTGVNTYAGFTAGTIDISMAFIAPYIIQLDAGLPLVLLGGVHAGCFELFGTERIKAIRDLKGKTVAVPELGLAHHVFVAAMASHVGIDPKRDINFVIHSPAESMQLLAEGKIDALMGFPPDPQELRERKIGHVIVNSGLDRPWSQYFCCIVAAHQEFVRKHPVATKRALRAILKATHFCAAEPERAARLVADKGYRYDYSLQTMKEIAYARWRDYDAEDTIRFYALRLREAGMIKSTPSKIIAQGTDWRFFNELKRELKS